MNTFNPFGLKPRHEPSGTIRPFRWVVPASDIVMNRTGPSAAWKIIYQNDAVYFDTNGRLQVSGNVSISTATPAVGSFAGMEFNDDNGRRVVRNYFDPNLIPASYTTNTGDSDVWLWLNTNLDTVYEVLLAQDASGNPFATTTPPFALEGNLLTFVQMDNMGKRVPSAIVGKSVGFAIPSGGGPVSSAGSLIVYNAQYRAGGPNAMASGAPVSIWTNVWNDPYPTVLVKLSQPQFAPAIPGF